MDLLKTIELNNRIKLDLPIMSNYAIFSILSQKIKSILKYKHTSSEFKKLHEGNIE